MYINFYNLKEKPFSLTPDSHFLFLSQKHKEALAHLRYGIGQRKGFILITGEVGAGKTTICRALLRELSQRHRVALILNPVLSPCGLLKAIVKDLGISCRSRARQELIQALNQYLISGEDVIVMIDEAQDLSRQALEQVRLLSNLETEKNKLLQLVLVGQPELKDLLSGEALRQLNQRIAVRYHIQPLNSDETAQYIYHRLDIAGAQDRIKFEEEATEEIYIRSGGVPRIINILCDYSLTVGYIHESWIITKDMVNQAVEEYQGVEPLSTVFV